MSVVKHYKGDDTTHFLSVRCPECTARVLASRTLAQVENWYHQGIVTQAAYEAYMYVWATSAVRYGDYPGWNEAPGDPEVLELVSHLREALMDRSKR